MKKHITYLLLLSLLFSFSLSVSASRVASRDTVMYIVKTNGNIDTYSTGEVDRVVFDVTKQTPSANVSSSHAVDLGLSVKWCDMNVGATSAEERGYLFSWGETEEKILYTQQSYSYYSNGAYQSIGSCISGTDLDAAHALWGSDWRMPTREEYQELINQCTWYWITQDGVQGYKVFGPNGNSIFLPVTGYGSDNSVSDATDGYYWAATAGPYCLNIDSSSKRLWRQSSRYLAYALRAVYGTHEHMNDNTAEDPNDNTAPGTAVDLGLSVKWANVNVGADSPEDYGGYFAWGETEEKDEYSEGSYLYYNNGYQNIGSDISGTDYDVAHVRWGGTWRMPTITELKELSDECTWTWTTQNGVNGYKVTGPNGNSIFLPAAGYRYGTSVDYAGSYGYYWSSSLDTNGSDKALVLVFSSYGHYAGIDDYRGNGKSVRPVCP